MRSARSPPRRRWATGDRGGYATRPPVLARGQLVDGIDLFDPRGRRERARQRRRGVDVGLLRCRCSRCSTPTSCTRHPRAWSSWTSTPPTSGCSTRRSWPSSPARTRRRSGCCCRSRWSSPMRSSTRSSSHGEALQRIGFEVEPFGGRAVVIHAVPSPHPRFDAATCFRETGRRPGAGAVRRLGQPAGALRGHLRLPRGGQGGPAPGRAGDARAAAAPLRDRSAAARRARPVHDRAAAAGGAGAPVWSAVGSRSWWGRPRSGRPRSPSRSSAHWPLEVISADSRQIYRRLDIGTAKPTPKERARVPHHGLDVVEPGTRYSAGRFARDAAGWIAEVRNRSRLPVVVGGTGLYVRALAEGLFHEPALDPARRRVARRVHRPARAARAAALGRSARPGIPRRRATAGRPRDRGGAAHRPPAHPLAGGRPRRRSASDPGTWCSPCPGRCCTSGSPAGRRRWCAAG